MITPILKATGLSAIALLLSAPVSQAQTAEQYNRASQAIQICGSTQGALIPECAKFRGQFGSGLSGGFAGGGTAGTAAGMANLLGGVMGRGSAPATVAPPPSVGIDLNKAITNCVARAAGDQVQIQRCLSIAGGGTAPHPR